jgi:hypothetical protein
MNFPLYDNGMASGLLAGLLFGFILEGAGFGSPRKLTAQFTLRDFAVFKVMFTAVIVAAVGLWGAEAIGWIKPNAVWIPTLYLWAIAGGGALIGAGFALGGYCPGTSAAALGSGRIDALGFIAGMAAGVVLFGMMFDDIRPLYSAAKGVEGQTLPQLLGLPTPVILIGLIVVAIAGFKLGTKLERARGGPVESS